MVERKPSKIQQPMKKPTTSTANIYDCRKLVKPPKSSAFLTTNRPPEIEMIIEKLASYVAKVKIKIQINQINKVFSRVVTSWKHK